MIIEIPNIEDFEEINKLAIQVHELHVAWRPDIYVSVEYPILKEEFKNMIENEEIYVAKMENKIIGYMILGVEEKDVNGHHYRKILDIDVICVDKEHQKQGIGKALMDYAMGFGKKQGCNTIQLTVNEENKQAIKFYEELGMRVRNIKYSKKI